MNRKPGLPSAGPVSGNPPERPKLGAPAVFHFYRAARSVRQRWGRRLEVGLWTVAALCATAVAATLLDRHGFQTRTERLLSEPSERASMTRSSPASQQLAVKPSFVARLEIPRVQLSALVVDGIDEKTLRRAVGRIPSSSLPGEPGDVALAGHRDTDFRSLRNVKRGDLVRLKTAAGPFEYRIESIRIVRPSRVDVLQPEDHATLTLITCYPFSFVGAAPLRYIVRAREVTRPQRVT